MQPRVLRSCGLLRVMCAVCLVVLTLCPVPGVAASNTRAFNGYYELSNVVKDGSRVQVTMTLTLRNAGKTAVQGGIVAVLNSAPNPVLIGSFSPIKSLPSKGEITVTERLTISAAEYESWQSGHAPRLQFLVPSGTTAVAEGIQAYQLKPVAN
jgi:hypothetical protein